MRLLQKTIRRYFILSLTILLSAIPIFYFLLQALVKEEIDEDLLVDKEALVSRIRQSTKNEAESFNYLDHDISMKLNGDTRSYDSFYSVKIYDSIAKEIVPHRILVSNTKINNNHYLISLRTSMVDHDNLIEGVILVQAIVMLLLFAGLQLINKNLSKNIWSPFQVILENLRTYKVEEHKKILLPATGINEFDELNNTITQLTERNYRTYTSQKEFAENASHEMQTPLAIFQSKLELLMQTSPLSNEQAELIGGLADAGERMNRLNKALILLSKIENAQFPEKSLVDPGESFHEVLKGYEEAITLKAITLTTEINPQTHIQINKNLFEILIGNLLSNAIRHNHKSGSINVLINEKEMIFRNSGNPALNDEKLFKRFQKDSSDQNSLGLGLEISAKICALNRFKISYAFDHSQHIFLIQFNV
jgi:signal transduction histidine kinase